MLLAALEAFYPGHPLVITFNAEKNRPMPPVDEVLGLVAFGYEGNCQRIL